MRIGIGYDVHRLKIGRKLIIGGVEIEYEKGLDGHSDADVLLHAIMDSMLGALALGDIGKFFPDTDKEYQDVDSMILLKKVMEYIENAGYRVINLDSVIAAQKPKLSPYIEAMRERIAEALHIRASEVGIKATTTEELGFEGREEGISARAVVLLSQK